VRQPSELETLLLEGIRAAGLPEPEHEYHFAKDIKRYWRFDYAWVAQKIAAEAEGATWARGRHTRGAGFAADCAKYNEATLRGWRVLRFTREQITGKDGVAVAALARALGGEGE